MTGAWILLAVLILATAFGVWRRRVDGRMRPVPTEATPEQPAETLTAVDLGADLGSTATLVQFSTEFCQPCRATRRILADVAGTVDGVAHVEVDAERRLDLVRRFGILRTPTILVLDAAGSVRTRASGLPSKADVLAAVGALA